MKYLCTVYCEEEILDALSKAEMDHLIDDSLAYDDVLRRSGHYLVSDALQSVKTAKTLRVRNGAVEVTDGPFAETKEQLLGFIVIDAMDMNDALEAAEKIPMARLGNIEVRPVSELEASRSQAGDRA